MWKCRLATTPPPDPLEYSWSPDSVSALIGGSGRGHIDDLRRLVSTRHLSVNFDTPFSTGILTQVWSRNSRTGHLRERRSRLSEITALLSVNAQKAKHDGVELK